MISSESVQLNFDRFTFNVSYADLKKFIINELERLSKITGYPLIPVKFRTNNKDDTVACFTYAGNMPVDFTFNLNKLDNTSANKIIDVCRHEFSHYVAYMRNKCQPLSNPHGAEWKRVCAELEAAPSPFLNNALTKHFKLT